VELLAPKASDFIENAHIYKTTEQQSLEFFASYNKSGIAPVKPNYDQIEQLLEPKQVNHVVEIIRPISPPWG
jgi:hypothetical protein